MWDFVLVCVLKPTTPNPRHYAVYKSVGNLKTSSPKRYVKENICFACFLYGNPEYCYYYYYYYYTSCPPRTTGGMQPQILT
jgi:hypothetical protein